VPRKFKAGKLDPYEYALGDFVFFIEEILGLKLWGCQRVWAEHFQWAVEDPAKRGMLCLAPADHGKSSRVVIPAILWLMCRDKSVRIILIGNTDGYAQRIGRQVARYITKGRVSKVLNKHFGLRKGDQWHSTEGYMVQRPEDEDDEKDPTLQCLGWGGEIQSVRADWLFFDDVATRLNSATLAKREKISSYVMTDARSRMDKASAKGYGKWFFFGHRVAPQDVYTQLEGKEDMVVRKDQAIVSDAEKKILAPESAHTYESLSEQRADDPVGFALLYQQQEIAMGIFITRPIVDAMKNRDLKFHYSIDDHVRSQFWKVFMSLDPAFSVSRHAKYSVLMVWGLTETRRHTLLYGLREKLDPERLPRVLETKFRVYQPDKLYIENNTAQALLIPPMRRAFPSRAADIEGIVTEDAGGRGQLDLDISECFKTLCATPPLVQLPYGCQASQNFVENFEEELCNYPNHRFTDMLMSYYIGMKGMGLIKQEQRRTVIPVRGVVGSVADARWSQFFQR
jgi:hypothetical protein